MGHRRRYDSLSAVASLAPLFFLFFASTPHTVAQNCTIDDNDFQDQASSIDTPSVTYSPPGAWVQGSECKNCSITKLDDISQVFNGTWHEALHTPGDLEPRVIRVTFYGTAIYAYFIVPDTVVTNTTFKLDGESAGELVHEPTGSPGFQYNVPGFVNTTLSLGYHRLEIIATGEVNPSRILFDCAVYTRYDSLDNPFGTLPTGVNSPDPFLISSPGYIPNVPAIIGSAVSSVIIVAGVIAFFCYCRRRRRRLDRIHANKTWPLPAPSRIGTFTDEFMKDDRFGPTVILGNTSVSINEVQSDIATIGTLRRSLPPPPPPPPPPQDPSDMKRTIPSPLSRATASCKPDLRRQGLQQPTELVQSTIETLRRQASVSTGEIPQNGGDNVQSGVGPRTQETETLWHRIAELQVEVEQLRAQQGPLDPRDVPPPVYGDRRTVPVR